jgi:hypothetical protein
MAIAILILPLVAGCSDDCIECSDPAGTNAPPFPPDGVFSVTGDEVVTVCWNQSTDPGVVAYGIYVNDTEDGTYDWIADVDARDACSDGLCCFDDTDVLNGETWYYAVTSINDRGLESQDLSYEVVQDTPRPEGYDLVLTDYLGQIPSPATSGYDFSEFTVQAWDDPSGTTDIYFGTLVDPQTTTDVRYLFTTAGVDIQDYGYIADASEFAVFVDWAPSQGWSNLGRVEALDGHAYIVRINRGVINFAKIWITSVTNAQVTFDWAYQEVTGWPELAPGSEPKGGASQ